MADVHLTLRLPARLARALTRWANTRDLSKSSVVREALTRYLDAPAEGDRGGGPAGLTARALAQRWAALPRLHPDEAANFAEDLSASAAGMSPPAPPWE